jgi:hypothetical protein
MSDTEKPSGGQAENADDFKQQFVDLPFNKKLSTLIQLEAATLSEAVEKIVDKSVSVGENVMDKLSGRATRE